MKCEQTALDQGVIVVNHIRKHGSITSKEAIMNYGITRLAARVFELRRGKYGGTFWNIKTTMMPPENGARGHGFALYTLGRPHRLRSPCDE